MTSNYIFTSERLGFRTWSMEDVEVLNLINTDTAVMEHFPRPLTKEESTSYIHRLIAHYKKHGYCYYATELKETGELIGFIGLAYQDFKASFTPNVDIGWRLKKSSWNNGYATEGAKRCLEYAFNELGLNKVIATCTLNNKSSEKVMQKIGMSKITTFKHPKLIDYPLMQTCLLYEITT